MASYSAIAPEAEGPDPMSSSTGSLRGRRRGTGKKNIGHVGQASWISSVINLANTILGAGLLAMPSALSKMGIFLGIIVIAWAGLTSGFGLYLQTRCARYVDRGNVSFAALSKLTYPNLSILFDSAIAIKCFGVAVSYLIIIGDLMPGVVKGFAPGIGVSYLLDRQFWITAFMLIVIPLSFLRRLDSLKYTSIIALCSIAYLVILVVAHFLIGDTLEEKGEVRVFQWAGPIPALAAFPVMVFAYTCHQNMFSILNEISDNSHFRTTSVIFASIGTGIGLYILTGITGYLSYGDNITGNIVSMYPTSAASTVGRLAIVVLVMFSYPLQIHPCRASIDACTKWTPPSRRGSNESSPSRNTLLNGPGQIKKMAEMSDVRFALITTILIVLSFITAMTVSSLEKVLAYVGSTGSTTISFILPGLFYYKISDPDSLHHQRLVKDEDDEDISDDEDDDGYVTSDGARTSRDWRRKLLRTMALVLAIYGGVVMCTCLAINIFFSAHH